MRLSCHFRFMCFQISSESFVIGASSEVLCRTVARLIQAREPKLISKFTYFLLCWNQIQEESKIMIYFFKSQALLLTLLHRQFQDRQQFCFTTAFSLSPKIDLKFLLYRPSRRNLDEQKTFSCQKIQRISFQVIELVTVCSKISDIDVCNNVKYVQPLLPS